MKRKITRILAATLVSLPLSIAATSCNDTASYSELLHDEEGAVNWYLAQNAVITSVPADSVFEVGEDAPFYRMNSDGTVYMRVIKTGDMDNRPVVGQTVYMRFSRYNIKYLYQGYDFSDLAAGNNFDLSVYADGISLVFGNTTLTSTTQYGTGLQVPLYYLGYNCEVDLVVKSTDGFTSEISDCSPYLYKNLKYFKAEY